MEGSCSTSQCNTFPAVGATNGKVITCKAAVLWGPSEPLVMQEVQVDPPQRMEVRVKILFTSICHTDLSAWKGQTEALRVYPRILGHEAAGVVESVGEGVVDIEAGDGVVTIFNGECGACEYCKSGKTNLCSEFLPVPTTTVMRSDGRTRFSVINGKGEEERREAVYHFMNTSTFAEYTVVNAACVVKMEDGRAPLRKMCLLSCGVTTGVGAAWNTANIQEGSKVAIFGLGAVGLAVAEGARLRKASQVIGIDINPEKLTKGREMGITDFIDSMNCDKPVHEVISEVTKGGVDYSFECTGNVDVLREAFLSTHGGWGLTVLLGIHRSPKLLPLHPMELFSGRRIVGCVFGDFKGKSQLSDFADRCMNEEIKINLDGFITHELPFAEINEAFQLLLQGKSLRCLLSL